MRNWKRIVQDAIRIATKLEKKLQGAEIEIYRLVRSKGSQGTQRLQKRTQCFWCEQHRCRRHVIESSILTVLVLQEALKVRNSCFKSTFCSKFHEKCNNGGFPNCDLQFWFFCFVFSQNSFFDICPKLSFSNIIRFLFFNNNVLEDHLNNVFAFLLNNVLKNPFTQITQQAPKKHSNTC